ncbi:MAG: ArsR family transcriptional regulator [Thermoproteota archaeon]
MSRKEDSDSLIQAVSYGKRRKIVELLAEEGPLTITELREKMKMSTGSLYHNLSFLQEFIEREGRKYKLNEKGIKLYRMIKEGNLNIKERNSIFELLLPTSLTYRIANSKVLSIFSSLAILATMFSFSYFWGMHVTLLTLDGQWIMLWARLTSLLTSLVLLFSFSFIISSTFKLKESVSIAETFSVYLISYVPQLIYYFLAIALDSLHTMPMEVIRLVAILISVLLLGTAIKTTTNLRSETSVVVAFFVIYFSSILETIVGRFAV